jgi:hypothetical protein
MAKKKKSIRKRVKNVRNNTSLFKPGEAKSLEQYIFASAMTGAFTALGAVIGTVLAKYLLNEVDKQVPLPAALHATIAKEAS